MGSYRERASDFLRRYLRELDASRDIPEPSLSVPEVGESIPSVALSDRYRTACASRAVFFGDGEFYTDLV